MADQLTITYERKISDGNYGSEGLSIGVTITADFDELAEAGDGDERVWPTAGEMYKRLRHQVLSHLAESEATRVAAVAHSELDPAGAAVTAAQAAASVRANTEDVEELPF